MEVYGTKKYLEKLLIDFNASMHCTSKNFDIEEYKNNSEQLLGRKDFIDFLVQKRNDLEGLYSTFLEMNFDNYMKYGLDFGSVLEFNSGIFDSLTIMNGDSDDEFEMTLMSDYVNKEQVQDLGIDHFYGNLTYLALSNEDDTVDCYYRLISYDKDKQYSIDDFDTFVNINPDKYESIVDTFAMAYAYDKYAIGGIVSNLYDKTLAGKLEVYEIIRNHILNDLEVEIEEQQVNYGGSIIRLMKY